MPTISCLIVRLQPDPPENIRITSTAGRRPTACWAGEGSCNLKIKQPIRCSCRESVAGEVFYCKTALSWTGNRRLDADNVPLALSPLSTGSAGWSGKGGRRGCWGRKTGTRPLLKVLKGGREADTTRKGLRFGYFGDSSVQNGATKGNPSFEAGPRGRGRASHPPPRPPLTVAGLFLAGGWHQGRGEGV